VFVWRPIKRTVSEWRSALRATEVAATPVAGPTTSPPVARRTTKSPARSKIWACTARLKRSSKSTLVLTARALWAGALETRRGGVVSAGSSSMSSGPTGPSPTYRTCCAVTGLVPLSARARSSTRTAWRLVRRYWRRSTVPASTGARTTSLASTPSTSDRTAATVSVGGCEAPDARTSISATSVASGASSPTHTAGDSGVWLTDRRSGALWSATSRGATKSARAGTPPIVPEMLVARIGAAWSRCRAVSTCVMPVTAGGSAKA
jgi:hypothetical protein